MQIFTSLSCSLDPISLLDIRLTTEASFPPCPYIQKITQIFISSHSLLYARHHLQQTSPVNLQTTLFREADRLSADLHFFLFSKTSHASSVADNLFSPTSLIPKELSRSWWNTLLSSLLCTRSVPTF